MLTFVNHMCYYVLFLFLNSTEFSSENYYLCVIPMPALHPQLSGDNFAFIDNIENTYEYLAKDGTSFTISPPETICSHFNVQRYLLIY